MELRYQGHGRGEGAGRGRRSLNVLTMDVAEAIPEQNICIGIS
jgi:hypothetical protein